MKGVSGSRSCCNRKEWPVQPPCVSLWDWCTTCLLCVLSCTENNNASRGQAIERGYSPGYCKCPCLVLLPISCRPRSTTADMTSSTQLSVRFPPSKIEAGPPSNVCVPNCHFRQNRNPNPSFFFYSFFFFVYYYLLFPFGFMLPRTTFFIFFFLCACGSPVSRLCQMWSFGEEDRSMNHTLQLLWMHIEWTKEPNNFI